jgi:TolA-binding protein
MKIQKSLADTSKQIEKQTAKINKINQNLHTLQKQLESEQKQSEILIQMRSDKSDSKTDISSSRASKEDNYYLVQKQTNCKTVLEPWSTKLHKQVS